MADHLSSPRDSFPRQNARTLRFTLGRPRSFHVSPDGRTVLFVRSASGEDRVGRLWRWTPEDGEVELVDPVQLLSGADEELSAEERARRERSREAAGGIVGYSTDAAGARAAFTLSGRLFVTEVTTGHTHELDVPGPVIDPRLDPTGSRVAFVAHGRLFVADTDGDGSRCRAVTPDEGPDTISWGQADFVAAEEHDRSRGFWWSPDGTRLLVQRTDTAPVVTWYVADPAHPASAPVPQRYPAAGTANAEVSLWVVDALQADGAADGAGDGTPGEARLVQWGDDVEYLATVHWSSRGLPVAGVLDREQRSLSWLAIDPTDGSTDLLRSITDDSWVDVVPGTGRWDHRGRLLTVEVRDDDYCLCADGVRLSPTGLDIRGVVDVAASDVLVLTSGDGGLQQVWSITDDGAEPVSPAEGVHAAARGGETVVLVSSDLRHPLPTATISTGTAAAHVVASLAATPGIEPRVTLLPGERHQPRVAVLLPDDADDTTGALPVLMDPYGGPHHRSVMQHQAAFREAQWLADQGFAVVVVDGRGTPGAPSWERAVRHDFADPVLEDQVTGLHAAAHAFPQLDLGRVAIRGWSFRGYLAALAVIDRPDVFHAAIAGAPVTDWLLYDTGYTERYLGVPKEGEPATLAPYEGSSLLERARGLTRPLQLIHGLADDNVFVAHSLQLSQVLTEHGRPHEVLPLSGITHMATQEDVAENLLQLQVDFLRRALPS